MSKKLLGILGALAVVGVAIGMNFLQKQPVQINPNLEYTSIQPQQPRALLSEDGGSPEKSDVIQTQLSVLYGALQRGDEEVLRATVAELKPQGPAVIERIRLALSEVGWSNIPKRRNYFYMLGLLKNDQGLPLIEEELARSDEVMSMDHYKSTQGLEMNDEALRESLLHHGTDVLMGENGTIRVSYGESQVAAIRALGMMKTDLAKSKLREVALREDLGLVTEAAVQTYLAIASDVERQALLDQVSEEKMRQLLVPADFKKFFPTDPSDGGGTTGKSSETE